MHPFRASSRAVRAITCETVGSNLDRPLQKPFLRATQQQAAPANTRPQPLAIPVTVGSPSHGIARSTTELHPAVTFFIGENGSGKSTLLEAIAVACGFNAEGGSKNFRFDTRTSHSELHRYLRIARGVPRPRDGFFLRAESFFNVATEIEKLDAEPGAGPPIGPSYGERPLHEQSHGESFLALLVNRFRGEGLYLLDEPEAALSPSRQLSVITRMHDLVQEKSQFIIATHSPILMAYPHAFIYAFSPKGIERVAYEETEHYRVTRDFLSNPQRMLQVLLAP